MWLLAVSPLAADSPRFVLSDGAGARLLVLEPAENAAAPAVAVCPGGTIHSIEYVERRTESSESTGRQTAANFDRLGGDLYRVTSAPAMPNASCLVMEPSHFATRRVLAPRASQVSDCGPADARFLSEAKERPVARCSILAELGGDHVLALVVFEPLGDELLASLVLIGAGKVATHDMPAKMDRSGTSAWRVDDGGEIEAEQFEVLFAMLGAEGLELAVEWKGAEGASVTLYRARGLELAAITEGYRYWSPM